MDKFQLNQLVNYKLDFKKDIYKKIYRLSSKVFKESNSLIDKSLLLVEERNFIAYNLNSKNSVISPFELCSIARWRYGKEDYQKYLNLSILGCMDYFDIMLKFYRKCIFDYDTLKYSWEQLNSIVKTVPFKMVEVEYNEDTLIKIVEDDVKFSEILEPPVIELFKTCNGWYGDTTIPMAYVAIVGNLSHQIWMISNIDPIQDAEENLKNTYEKIENILKGDS
jgi:hypothetical protein